MTGEGDRLLCCSLSMEVCVELRVSWAKRVVKRRIGDGSRFRDFFGSSVVSASSPITSVMTCFELSRDFVRKRRRTAGELSFERRTLINERDFFNEALSDVRSALFNVEPFVRLIVDDLRNKDDEGR